MCSGGTCITLCRFVQLSCDWLCVPIEHIRMSWFLWLSYFLQRVPLEHLGLYRFLRQFAMLTEKSILAQLFTAV